jgi:phage terminase large subunit
MALVQEATKIELKATRVFFENFVSDKRININIGGGGSSKSHSIIQLLLYKFLTEENKKFLVIRKTMPSIRTSVLIPFYEIMNAFGVRNKIKEDKVGMNLLYNNNIIHFNGLDDPEKVKSANWHYMWFEEATEITKDDFNTVRLYLRAPSADGKMNQIFLSFNPIDEFHWIKQTLIDDPAYSSDVKVVHSTYKDNPFLPEDSVKAYEDLMNQDINFYRIYALGEWGRLEDLIYKNWDEADSMPTDNVIVTYGVDFGFNAESAVIRCITKGQEVWEQELVYKKGLTNSQLIDLISATVPKSELNKPWYCDSAAPDRIREFRLAGFNAKEATKNINDGIDLIKRLKVHVLKGSNNIIKEKRAYSWKKDRNGNIVDEPVDFLNHLMDAERYAIYSHFRGSGILKVRWL